MVISRRVGTWVRWRLLLLLLLLLVLLLLWWWWLLLLLLLHWMGHRGLLGVGRASEIVGGHVDDARVD